MSLIQPQQQFEIPQNQYVQNNNNTFQSQPNEPLMVKDLCVGRIVFLPQSSRGIENVKCILPHSQCLSPELDPMAYGHFFVIIDVFQKKDGQVKCYICIVTTKQVVEKFKRRDKRIPIRESSKRPNFSVEQVYLERGSMPQQSYIRVSHVYEISFSLLQQTRMDSQACLMRLMERSYFRLMREIKLEPGVYEKTGPVIRLGARIRREDSRSLRNASRPLMNASEPLLNASEPLLSGSGPSLNGSGSAELGTPFPDQDLSEATSSSELSEVLVILARPESQAILNYSNPQYDTMISALDAPSTETSISTSPVSDSTIEQSSNDHMNLHSAVSLATLLQSPGTRHPASQPVPVKSSPPTNINTSPPHEPQQLQLLHPPPLNLKKALILLSSPLSRFPHHLLKAILLIGAQPWGKLCLYSLVLLACYYTGTLKLGLLAIKGLDGWLATLGTWSAPRDINVVRVLGKLVKGWARLTSPVLMRVVKVVGGLLKDVGLWVVRRIVRRG